MIQLWLTAFFAHASPVRSAELGSWSNGRLDLETSSETSRQRLACQNAGKNLSSKTARLAYLNYLTRSSSADTFIGLNCGSVIEVSATADCASHTPPWLASGSECRGRCPLCGSGVFVGTLRKEKECCRVSGSTSTVPRHAFSEQ
jgi:hypothetical protein